MRNIMIFGILILATFILSACEGVDLSQLSDEDLGRIADQAIVCDTPYIRHGTGCCLDADNSKICDDDETGSTESNDDTQDEIVTEDSSNATDEVVTVLNIELKAEITDAGVELKWSKYNGLGFEGYKVVRSYDVEDPKYPEEGYLKYITNIDTLQYIDAETLEDDAHYAITVVTQYGNKYSNSVEINAPEVETPEVNLSEEDAEDNATADDEISLDGLPSRCQFGAGEFGCSMYSMDGNGGNDHSDILSDDGSIKLTLTNHESNSLMLKDIKVFTEDLSRICCDSLDSICDDEEQTEVRITVDGTLYPNSETIYAELENDMDSLLWLSGKDLVVDLIRCKFKSAGFDTEIAHRVFIDINYYAKLHGEQFSKTIRGELFTNVSYESAPDEELPLLCVDQDEGLAIYEKDTAIGISDWRDSYSHCGDINSESDLESCLNDADFQIETFEDYCHNSNELNEMFCENGFVKQNDRITCTYGCEDGACLTFEESNKNIDCSDTDGDSIFIKGFSHGWSKFVDRYVVEGDYCLDDVYLHETACSSDNVPGAYSAQECEFGCRDGACINPENPNATQPNCVDSDNTVINSIGINGATSFPPGDDRMIAGNVEFDNGYYVNFDHCVNKIEIIDGPNKVMYSYAPYTSAEDEVGTHLVEYGCINGEGVFQLPATECEFGCKMGACLEG